MAGRTVFVNPSRRRRRKKGRRRSRRRNAAPLANTFSNPRRRRARRSRRRNAGITPFLGNPMIMSNPRRRRRHSNPLNALSLKNIFSKSISYGGGAGIAVAANALALNRVDNVYMRNGARVGLAVLGASMLKGDLGAGMAGAMFYPVIQELAALLLGKSTVTGTEADMDVLAADLEDVMDELDEHDLSDDADEYGIDNFGDDDDILS